MANMSINSRRKGAANERAFAKFLQEHGFTKSRRGCQFEGSTESPDVRCDDLPEIFWEIKAVEKLNVRKALDQAIRDSKRIRYPVVAHKVNHGNWLVTMEARDFLDIVRRSDLPLGSPSSMPLQGHPSKPLDAQGVETALFIPFKKGKTDSQ